MLNVTPLVVGTVGPVVAPLTFVPSVLDVDSLVVATGVGDVASVTVVP